MQPLPPRSPPAGSSSPPSPVRRLLTAEEAVRLSGGRAVAESLIAADWRLSPEEAARIAMAWPAYTPLVSTRLQ
ncbi:hypothetical protein [Methylorubrum sp. SL192]|uniref:hypothetical protein n=1 Tax=Methylorubrum sp. SL192 TaxID=2995167 RepID=UPI002273BCD9|nr:hypothetical protein [Methylorubrum sp. SL192]MCY1644942.1 hypothetical protein [Methylorubrum sp. SL192]